MSLEAEAKKILVDWMSKQGHDQCWYYPDIFQRLAELFGIECPPPALPSPGEFASGCRRFQLTLFKDREMDPILMVALIAQGALKVLDLAQKLQEQHANGTPITEAQAEELRNLAIAERTKAEEAWKNA